MVEGPGVHRVAIAHRRVLLGRAFICSSPSGRFTEGAEIINGLYLSLIEAHGKNIFYFFTKHKMDNAALENLPEDVIVIHIHFGMSGSFRTYKFPGPEPRETTRLRLENEEENVVAHLSAMWCVHGGMDLYRNRLVELGPDPLREDADKEIAWNKMQKTKKSIGAFLMDQSMIAGIGNIYRCEILFVCGVHPNQRSSSISRPKFEDIWKHSERLLQVGVQAGSIITVSPEDAGKPFSKLKSGERRYIYNHKMCRKCGGPVINWVIATRTCYACEGCQPPVDLVDPPRKKLMVSARSKRSVTKGTEPADDEVLHESNGTLTNESVTKACLVTERVSRIRKTSAITFRKRKVLDGKIVEHQALKDIPTGGLVDFPTNLDDLIWPSADPKTLKKENKTSDSVPSSLASLSAVMDLSIEQENPVTGRKGRTGRKQKAATDDKIEAKNKNVKRARNLVISGHDTIANRLSTADEDPSRGKRRRSQRVRRVVCPPSV